MATSIVVGLFMTSSGCGKAAPKNWPVNGKVVFVDGKPMTGGRIEFEAIGQKPPVTARANIGVDGTFTLSTYGRKDGAVPGKHRVAIFPPSSMSSTGDKHERPEILEERRQRQARLQLNTSYQNILTSGIERQVLEESNDFEIVVEYEEE